MTSNSDVTVPAEVIHFSAGNYRYVKGGFQYSAAVIADSGFVIERARLTKPLPLGQGFALIKQHLLSIGRPLTALCSCELRSPAPMSEADFIAFNRAYVQPLADWGLFKDDANPVARCNLIPQVDKPPEASFYAFSYTVPTASISGTPDFITAGAAECPDRPDYRKRIVRLGETTPDALSDKLRYALGDIELRLDAMGVGWSDALGVRLYTVHDLHHVVWGELSQRGALAGGLDCHWVRPPVIDLEIEIDVSRISRQIAVAT